MIVRVRVVEGFPRREAQRVAAWVRASLWMRVSFSAMMGSKAGISAALLPCSCLREPKR